MTTVIKTAKQFLTAVEEGDFTNLGGYPLAFIFSDAECIHPRCAKENKELICGALEEQDQRDQWFVVEQFINYEHQDLVCVQCNEKIESAYPNREEGDYQV